MPVARPPSLRWGVLGARSRIYRQRLRPALDLAGQRVVAEASRRGDDDSGYHEVVADPNVDAVYVPLPNHLHLPWVSRALDAGKHVLCEKPLTLSAPDTILLYERAAAAGRLLSEAYLWPHHPRSEALLELTASGELGRLVGHHASFQYDVADGDHRLDARGAGALFDVGIYCLGPAVLMAPQATGGRAVAAAVRNEAGVDTSMSGWVELGEGSGFAASFVVCCEAPPHRSQEVVGTAGSVLIDHFVPGPERAAALTVARRDGSRDEVPHAGANAYERMVSSFASEVAGEAGSRWGPGPSIRLARLLDTLHHASRPVS